MNQPQSSGSFQSIPLDHIRPSGTNPRKHFDQAKLEELAESIRAMGVTQPVLLRPRLVYVDAGAQESYEIVSGERRYRASRIAGKEEIPALVREMSDEEALQIQMIENLQRQDLHPMEEADGYRALMASGATAEDVAKKAGKTLGYVLQRLKLLQLEVDAKEIFAAGHITQGHALLLARLTPHDQERAITYSLLGLRDWEIDKKKTPSENIQRRLRDRASSAKNGGGRVISTTEDQLHDWIKSNVLLVLKGVPWDLGDAELLPAAGPCTTCEKRAGTNAALFQDLTTVAETCTDPACFAEKQKAFAAQELRLAKEAGTPLLKLSAKSGHDKLEEPAVKFEPGPLAESKPGVKNVRTSKPVVVARKAIREGQWVEAKKGECPSVVQGIFTDGPNRGKTRWVCVDQSCKVHKHTVTTPRATNLQASAASSNAPKLSPAEALLEGKKRERETKKERFVTMEILRMVHVDGTVKEIDVTRKLVRDFWEAAEYDVDVEMIAEVMGLKPAKHKTTNKPTMAGAIETFLDKEPTPGVLMDFASLLYVAYDDCDRSDLIMHAMKSGAGDPKELIRDLELQFEDENPLPAELAKPAPAKAAKKAVKKSAAKPKAVGVDKKSAAAGAAAEARA